jgi:predicted transcriptional regulator
VVKFFTVPDIKAKVKKMKTITLSDDIMRELEELSARLGISPEEIIRRAISEYLREPSVQDRNGFEPIGFGMWAGRDEMDDSAQWVHRLREQEWNRQTMHT